MTDHRTASPADAQHAALWRDRLLDAIDGALSSAEMTLVADHVRDCARCAAEQRRLQDMDARLRANTPQHATPSADFDARLFKRIAANEADARIEARLRERRDHQARLSYLQRNWRGYWRFNLGNILGGAAAFASVVGWIASTTNWLTLTAEWVGRLGTDTFSGTSLILAALALAGLSALAIGLIGASDQRAD